MAGRAYNAPDQSKAPIPAYRVVDISEQGPFEMQGVSLDSAARTIVRHSIVSEEGYLVIFPRGHQTFYTSLESLENAGFGEVVPLIRADLAGESEMNKEHDADMPRTRRKILKPEDLANEDA